MFDGIKLITQLINFDTWRSMVQIPFTTRVNIDTGELSFESANEHTTAIYEGTLGTYSLIVKKTCKKLSNGNTSVECYLFVKGSLHKNHFDGCNYKQFKWCDVQSEIQFLERRLLIDASEFRILNVEFGVNIQLPFPVIAFLNNNLLLFKTSPFNRYKRDLKGVCLGYTHETSEFEVKIYDKGLQYNLPYPLMRVELKFTTMRKLQNLGIRTLADLKDLRKTSKLLKLLLKAWDAILLYDDTIDVYNNSNLKSNERELLVRCSSNRNLLRLKKENERQFYEERNRLRKLIAKHGTSKHKYIRNKIQEEWQCLSVLGKGNYSVESQH